MNDPIVREVQLAKDYRFMYENFVFATQYDLYLLMEKNVASISALKFRFISFKYGSPNDEARGSHSMTKCGLGWYGLYKVENSPWIQELMTANRIHERHNDSLFSDLTHLLPALRM
jgi:hypothetical protein